MSKAYHPKFNGQTEIVNKSLEQYLRAFIYKLRTFYYSSRFLTFQVYKFPCSSQHVGPYGQLAHP